MRDRILELIQPAIEALREQKKLNHKSDWVFVNPNTKNPWTYNRISSPWNDALRKFNIEHRRAYATRHTYASVMLSSGMSLKWLKEKMGHSNYRMLEETYASWMTIRSTEKRKIRDWVLAKSQNGHIPDTEKDFSL